MTRDQIAAAEAKLRALPDVELEAVAVPLIPDPAGLWKLALSEIERRERERSPGVNRYGR
jgi:hypothetical protein